MGTKRFHFSGIVLFCLPNTLIMIKNLPISPEQSSNHDILFCIFEQNPAFSLNISHICIAYKDQVKIFCLSSYQSDPGLWSWRNLAILDGKSLFSLVDWNVPLLMSNYWLWKCRLAIGRCKKRIEKHLEQSIAIGKSS